MDENLTEKIRSLLSDPQAAERIASIAEMLGAGSSPSGPQDAQPASAQQGPNQPSSPPPLSSPSQSPPYRPDPRLDLLRALRPFASEEKRTRIDDLIRIATVASLLGGLKN